jgi:thiamine-phosphate pyrophosphorylase
MTVQVPIDPELLRVYVVTTSTFAGRSHADVVDASIEGGATAVQLRAPELAPQEVLLLARELAPRCRAAGVRFLVNDHVDVAVAAGADGVHVGQGDAPARARALLGRAAVLGISAASPEEARAAEAAGADYLGVTVWGTATKPEAAPRGLEGLRAVAAATRLPVVGIGGIDASNAGDVVAAGAAGVAVVSAVAGASDPVRAVRELRAAVAEALDPVRGGAR